MHPHHASLDPASYHKGLLERAMESGVIVKSHCHVLEIKKTGQVFQVRTSSGTLKASDVVLETSGYTGETTPWLRRRMIPIGSYMIATEELEEDLVKELIPMTVSLRISGN